MGNCNSFSDPPVEDVSEKILKALAVETPFKFPSPLPTLPQGGGFARRTIDLGGLEVSQVSTFNKVWCTYEGGPDNLGATFFEPSSIPSGFSILGYYAQPNNRRLFGWVLTARDLSNNTLKPPVDYTLVANTESLKIKQDGPGYFWQPVAPDGYQAVGLIVTNSSQKPPLDKLRCVRSDLTEQCEADTPIWESNGANVSNLRPTTRGTQATGVSVGTFTYQTQNASPLALSCLKNTKFDLSAMPNGSQIGVLFQTYSPLIYFHPDEEYLPSSVNWYFSNGALLYKRGEESNPVSIESNGSNLPQGGSNDGTYWLDLPVDKKGKERVKKGDLESAKVYLHIKPMLGATFTDVAIWVFYPFNGPARAKVKFVNLPLGKIGEHIGDWEHATLRISNFNGELWRMFLSQHSGGVWIDACDLEFGGGGGGSNKPVAYASLHGHAMYPKPGLVLQGDDGVGIRNDTAKSKKVIDTGSGYEVIAAEYGDGDGGVAEPPWLNYLRKWGPKIDYNVDDDVKRIERLLPGSLKKAFVKFSRKIPDEVYGEDGPTGPKLKGSWSRDEN
uniref:Vacuolar protein sorting-associated protein 62 n=1 Tax=Noccaea caerulescens TaxID=107243 RepID=A0A1J3IJG5_NOCCA